MQYHHRCHRRGYSVCSPHGPITGTAKGVSSGKATVWTRIWWGRLHGLHQLEKGGITSRRTPSITQLIDTFHRAGHQCNANCATTNHWCVLLVTQICAWRQCSVWCKDLSAWDCRGSDWQSASLVSSRPTNTTHIMTIAVLHQHLH